MSINPEDLKGAVLIDIRPEIRREAGLSIGRTFLISLILLIGALMFTNQTNNLVVKPIVDMIDTVTKITSNPLLGS